MTGDNRDLVPFRLCLPPGREELKRLLIEQFYETSVYRYGSDSQQALLLSSLLTPPGLGAEKASS